MKLEEGMLVAIYSYPGVRAVRIKVLGKLSYRVGIIKEKDGLNHWKVKTEDEIQLQSISAENMRALLPYPLPKIDQGLYPPEAFKRHLSEIICALVFSVNK